MSHLAPPPLRLVGGSVRHQGSVVSSVSSRIGTIESSLNELGHSHAAGSHTPRRGLELDPYFLHLKNEVHREQFEGELLADKLRKVHIRIADIQEERQRLTEANENRRKNVEGLKDALVGLKVLQGESQARMQDYESALESIHSQRQETAAEGRRRQLLSIRTQQELVQTKHALETRKQTVVALQLELAKLLEKGEDKGRAKSPVSPSMMSRLKEAQQLALGTVVPPDPAPALIVEAQSEATGLRSRLKMLHKEHEELKRLAIGSQILAEIEVAQKKCQGIEKDIRQKFPECPLLPENARGGESKESNDHDQGQQSSTTGGSLQQPKLSSKLKGAVRQINKARNAMGALDSLKKVELPPPPRKPAIAEDLKRPQPSKPQHHTLLGVSKDLFRRPMHVPRTGRVRLRVRRQQYRKAVDKLNYDLRELGNRRTVPRSMAEAVLQCAGNGSAIRWQLARLRAEDQCSRRAMLRESCRCRSIIRWSNERATAANDKAAKAEQDLGQKVANLTAQLKDIQDETSQAHGSHVAVRVIHDYYMNRAQWLGDQIATDAEDLKEVQNVAQQWHTLPAASRTHHYTTILRRKLENKAARLKAVIVGCAGVELDIRKIERKQIKEGVGEGGSVRWVASGELVDGDAQTDPSGYISSWHLYEDELAIADGKGGTRRGSISVSVLEGMGVLLRFCDPSSYRPLCIFIDTEHARFLCQDSQVFGISQISNNNDSLITEEDFSGKRIVQWLRIEWLQEQQYLLIPRTPSDFGTIEDQVQTRLPLECICNDTSLLTDSMIFKGLPCTLRVLQCHCRVCGLSYVHIGIYCPLTGWSAWRSRGARDLCRSMGHRKIETILKEWGKNATRIRMQALVSEIFAADVPTDPWRGSNSSGFPPLMPASTEAIQWSWKVLEEEKTSLVRHYMKGHEKHTLASSRPTAKRESVKVRRASMAGTAMPGTEDKGKKLSILPIDGAAGASAAFSLRKNIEEDAKNFGKACDELAFLRFDAEIGADGTITLSTLFDEPPPHGQAGKHTKKLKKDAKARASLSVITEGSRLNRSSMMAQMNVPTSVGAPTSPRHAPTSSMASSSGAPTSPTHAPTVTFGST